MSDSGVSLTRKQIHTFNPMTEQFNPKEILKIKAKEIIHEEIEKLREIHSKKETPFEAVKASFSSFMNGHSRVPYKISIPEVFRARKNSINLDFTDINELWYPNWDDIDKYKHKYGRCNNLGESIFYCSNDFDTTIIECRPQVDEIITVVNLKIDEECHSMKLQPIGINELIKLPHGVGETFQNYYANLKSSGNYDKNLLIDSFLNEIFTEKIESIDEWKYKSSASISSILLFDDHEGIIYPSTSLKAKGANFALKPQIPDRYFKLATGSMYKIIGVGNNSCELQLIKILDSVENDKSIYKKSKLNWKEINPIFHTKDEIFISIDLRF
jgi:hypothetical protein